MTSVRPVKHRWYSTEHCRSNRRRNTIIKLSFVKTSCGKFFLLILLCFRQQSRLLFDSSWNCTWTMHTDIKIASEKNCSILITAARLKSYGRILMHPQELHSRKTWYNSKYNRRLACHLNTYHCPSGLDIKKRFSCWLKNIHGHVFHICSFKTHLAVHRQFNCGIYNIDSLVIVLGWLRSSPYCQKVTISLQLKIYRI